MWCSSLQMDEVGAYYASDRPFFRPGETGLMIEERVLLHVDFLATTGACARYKLLLAHSIGVACLKDTVLHVGMRAKQTEPITAGNAMLTLTSSNQCLDYTFDD